MQLFRSDVNLTFLLNIIPQVKFALYQSDDNKTFINCFVAYFEDNESCAQYWRAINNEIAVEYQPSLPDEFSSWNIYLALVTPLAMDKHLKYRLENDRFALRKIVLSGPSYVSGTCDEMTIEHDGVRIALENSILGRDLKLSSSADDVSCKVELSNPFREFLSTMSPLPLDGKDKSSEVRRVRINELLEWSLIS